MKRQQLLFALLLLFGIALSANAQRLNKVIYEAGGVGYAVGNGGRIYKTTNSGATWAPQASGTTQNLFGVSVRGANMDNVTVVGNAGTILTTTNGGATWTTQASGGQDLTGVSFASNSPTVGVAVGLSGTIRRTTDGGVSWSTVTSPTTESLTAVKMANQFVGWAVGVNGVILYSNNGGASWSTQTSSTTQVLYDVACFSDFVTAVAVGANGTILRTTNGGASWSTQTSGTSAILYGVSFVSLFNSTVSAVGSGGTIRYTSNSGANWTAQTSGTTQDLYSVAFAGDDGVAVGANDTTLRTTNRGSTWTAGTLENVITFTINPATNVTNTGATLSGTINPNGLPLTLARFEYSSDPTFGAFATINTTPSATAIGSGFSPVAVSAAIPMSPNSVVFARLRATNANGTSLSPTISFNNLPSPIPSLPTSGLQLWLRADSLVAQTSGLVSQWNDLSGNTRHAFSTGSARPALASSAVFNNRAVIDFGNVGNKQLGFRRISNVRTAFIVGRSILPSIFQFLLGDSTTFQFHPSTTGLVDAGFAAVQVQAGLVFLNGRPFAATAAGRPSTPTIMMFQTAGDAETSTIARDRALTDNRGWRGEVAEVIIYNRALSDAERVQVQSYLAQRYAIDVQTFATPSVPANNFSTYILGITGVTVTFTTASTTAGSLLGSVINSRPNIVGTLPTGVVNLAERFWTINQSGLTGFTCALTFNLSTLGGVQNFNNLKVLRRNNASSPWVDVETLSGVTITRNAPFITVAGLTSFSDFTIGSDASNQLPVELTEFTGRKSEQGVELAWRTASELNNAGFEVQRRSENRGASEAWQVLGFVRGAGTTTEAQSYSFLDKSAVGKVQYCLKQIDFDGQFEYSNIIEVDAGLPKVFALEQNYPNPFNPTTVISYQLPVAGNVSLKVYDVLGREVMTLVNGRQDAGAYNFTLNAASLSSGVYFYRLQSGNFVQTKKMMLVK
jgi:photosystem II stability/assembly factor-like uncharacterized protein